MWEIAVHLAVTGGVYDDVFLCCLFSQEMSWMRSWTSLSQLLRVFLPTLDSSESISVNIKIVRSYVRLL